MYLTNGQQQGKPREGPCVNCNRMFRQITGRSTDERGNTVLATSLAAYREFGREDVLDPFKFDEFFKELILEDAMECTYTGDGRFFLIDLQETSGSFPLFYDMQFIPDGLKISYEGSIIFSTGGLVSGFDSVNVAYNGSSSVIAVTVYAPEDGTIWNVEMGCPSDSVAPTSVSTQSSLEPSKSPSAFPSPDLAPTV